MSSSLTINRKTREKRVAAASGKYSGSLWAWITKIALLGILDATAFHGSPDHYGDNSGFVTANVAVQDNIWGG